jgi:hypothetical protein
MSLSLSLILAESEPKKVPSLSLISKSETDIQV